jgi:hypothetical protein
MASAEATRLDGTQLHTGGSPQLADIVAKLFWTSARERFFQEGTKSQLNRTLPSVSSDVGGLDYRTPLLDLGAVRKMEPRAGGVLKQDAENVVRTANTGSGPGGLVRVRF